MPEAKKKAPKKRAQKKTSEQNLPEKIDISGQVLDAEGGGIADAIVELLWSGPRTFTDAEGKYSLTDVSLGEDSIRVIATGYEEKKQPLDLTKKLEKYDITLESI